MKHLLLSLSFLTCIGASAQQSFNMVQKSHLTYLNDNNDIWGYTDSASGTEYALVGTTAGVSIVDISMATAPMKKQFVQGPYSIWRDLKTWGHYAYVTHDSPYAWNQIPEHGLLIIDMDSVDNPLPTYKNINYAVEYPAGVWDTLKTAHNLYIDENGYCYLFGANIGNGGALILDLNSDPWNPTVVGIYDDYYFHDGMVRGDTLWGSAVYTGKFVVVDVTQKDSAMTLATHGTPNSFTHNTWISDDNNTLFCTDEVGGAFLSAYDVSDLNNITELDRIQSSLDSGVIPHNAHVRGQWVVTSYYTSGVQIVDAKYPELLVEVGYFDTSPNFSGGGFYGNWGAYPYFESDLIICSDIEEGLWVLEPTYVEASRLHVVVYDSITKAPMSNVNISFDKLGKVVESNIDGLADIGTPLQVQDSLVVSMPGFVTHRQQYQWVGGIFDTVRVALLNVNNIGLGEEAEAPIVIQPNPSQGQFTLNGVEDATFALYNTAGVKVYEGKTMGSNVELPQLPHGHYILALDGNYGFRRFPLLLLP